MAELQELLESTSRTFALAIPLLPEPSRTDVTLAYLLFRIADTLEDAERWPVERRAAALQDYADLLACPSIAAGRVFSSRCLADKPTDNDSYCRLLQETGSVLQQIDQRALAVRELLLERARETSLGMRSFLQRGPASPGSLSELQEYCYVVAGIVGELLTDIFSARISELHASQDLRSSARAFGEGLQLVNILKDSNDDLQRGRQFVPPQVDRSTVFQLARRDLLHAREYVDELRNARAPAGYLAFTQLPLNLAVATLDGVEQHGPGWKVPRAQVARFLAKLPSQATPCI